RLEGCDVVDQDGDKVGSVDGVYLDDDTGAPEFALVKAGIFGMKSRFVPLREASEEGDAIRVPFAKDKIKDAPSLDPDGHLSQQEETALYEYYGMDYSEAASRSGLPAGAP